MIILLPAVMPLIGSDVSDGAVPMLAVVPADEASHPALGASQISERHVRISRGVLE